VEGNLLLDVHRRTDELIGQVLAAIDQDTTVFVVSDHGGGSLLKEVFLNNWLKQQGWLYLKQSHASQQATRGLLRRIGFTRENLSKRLSGEQMMRLRRWIPLSIQHAIAPSQTVTLDEAVDWSNTKAYSFGYVGQIYVNLKGREPQGIVSPGEEYNRVLEEITAQLFDLRDMETSEKVVDQVYRGDKVYSGQYASSGPDLTIIMKNMSYLAHSRRELAHHEIFATPATDESGTHRPNGMFVIKGRKFKNRTSKLQAEIIDVMPTVLFDLGEPVPSYVDGKPIFDSVKSDNAKNVGVVDVEISQAMSGKNITDWDSEEEEKEVMDRLRALGYIE